MGRRKQRGSRDATNEREPAKNRPSKRSTAPADPPLSPAKPPRRNVPLLLFSIALFLAWLAVLVILANYR